jgi:hypothetical protein
MLETKDWRDWKPILRIQPTKNENFSENGILIKITVRILHSSRNVGPTPLMEI